jgi:N-acetylglucosamine transport system substrate-binding protein
MRNIMKKSIFMAVFFLLMTAALFAAARRDTAGASPQTMKFYAFNGGWGRAYFDDMVAQFQAANPGVTVELTIDSEVDTILRTDAAAGQWPDLVYPYQSADEFSRNREILDITDVIDSDVPGRPGTKIRNYILDGILENTAYSPYGDGKIYRAPFITSSNGLVYNKNLFDSKGWKVPGTWDEFFALGRELEKPENYVTIDGQRVKRSLFTYQGIYPSYLDQVLFSSIAGALGQEGVTRIMTYTPGSFSGPEVRQVVENLARLGSGGFLMEGTAGLNHTQSQADMMLGKALFIPCGNWIESEMKDSPREPGFSFAMAAAPVLRAGQDHYAVSGGAEFLFIPSGAKNPALAKEFIKFLYSDASVISFAKNASGVFAVKNAVELGRPYLPEGTYGMFQIYNTAKALRLVFDPLPENSRLTVDLYTNLGLVVNGGMTVNDYIAFVEDFFTQVARDKANAR